MEIHGPNSLRSVLAPGGWLLAAAILLHAGLVTPTVPIVTLLYDGAVLAGLLLALRFHSSRVFFGLIVLFLAERALSYFVFGRGPVTDTGRTAVTLIGVLVPLNFVVLAFLQERGFAFANVAPPSLLLFVQSVIVAVMCRPPEPGGPHSSHRVYAAATLPFSALLAFATAAVVLLARSLALRRPVERAFLWATATAFLALQFRGTGLLSIAYFATAAFILTVSVVDTSYLLAYHDELTALPSRRAFNTALLGLQAPYSIAMVDIDHFKRFNDTYGHDTGDQVLQLVANRLARVTGGGQAYRCGGEEFAVLFPSKTTKDVVDHLEQLRAVIEKSTFRLRGKDRRQLARGPDRRHQRARGRGQTGRAIRELTRNSGPLDLSVTVSIGVASSGQERFDPDSVILAADKALYRAKAGGRNRVETASFPRRRVRVKAAGIA